MPAWNERERAKSPYRELSNQLVLNFWKVSIASG